MALPRFVRPIGVLPGVGSRFGVASGVGVLDPFDGVLNVSINRQGGIPLGLTYLTLTDLFARWLADQESREGRRDPTRAISDTEGPDTSRGAAARPEPDPELKVYQLLRASATPSDPSDEVDRPVAGRADSEHRQEPRSDQAARQRSTASSASGGAGDSIRELRRMNPEWSGPTRWSGAQRSWAGSLRVLDSPRTILAMRSGVRRGDMMQGGFNPMAPAWGDTSRRADMTRRSHPAITRGESPDRVPETGGGDGHRREPSFGASGPSDAPASAEDEVRQRPPSVIDRGQRPNFSGVRGRRPDGPGVSMTVLDHGDGRGDRERLHAMPTAARDSGPRGRRQTPGSPPSDGLEAGETPTPHSATGDTREWEFPENISLEGGGPDARFIEELYRELTKKMRIDRERRGH